MKSSILKKKTFTLGKGRNLKTKKLLLNDDMIKNNVDVIILIT